jgi:hypothetical protein
MKKARTKFLLKCLVLLILISAVCYRMWRSSTTTYTDKLLKYLPSDCFLNDRYSFAWIIPIDSTNVSTYSYIVNVAKEVCSTLFEDVHIIVDNILIQPNIRYSAFKLLKPKASFNESTNIDNSE